MIGLRKYSDVTSSIDRVIKDINKEEKCAKSMGTKLKEIGHLYQKTEKRIIETNTKGNTGEKEKIWDMSKKIADTASNLAGRDMPEGYILVDSMDYIPMNEDLRKRLYENDTGEVDKNGNPIYGLANLHNSATAPDGYDPVKVAGKYVVGGALSQFLTAGDLMNNFLFGNGEDYYYNATSLLVNGTVRKNFEDNIQNMARASEQCLKDNETLIIANSQDNALPGCQTFLDQDGDLAQAAKCIANANTFASINSADAGIVCEVTRDGNHYTMNYSYYIIDYYDYDKNILGELYDLNRYGYANNFLGFGEITGTYEWDADEK